MTKRVKAFLTVVCCLTLVVASVVGTLAYLTDTETTVNTFTIGKVAITVDEAPVDADGNKIVGNRVTGNSYKLIPGKTYDKDPTMTVLADSEPSYVRMILTISHAKELDQIFDPYGPDVADLSAMFKGYNLNKWRLVSETPSVDTTANTMSYEFRYVDKVGTLDGNDKALEPLFTSFVAPSVLDSDDLAALTDFKITVEGHAIQAEGFADADAAWAAFKIQNR